jgi:hypothetical protein
MVGAMRARIELDYARRVRGRGIIEQQEVIRLACLENTLKLTPPATTVAPSGKLLPVSNGSCEVRDPAHSVPISSMPAGIGANWSRCSETPSSLTFAFGTAIWLISILREQFCRESTGHALTSIKPADSYAGFARISRNRYPALT